MLVIRVENANYARAAGFGIDVDAQIAGLVLDNFGGILTDDGPAALVWEELSPGNRATPLEKA